MVVPLVYSQAYDITAFGLEMLHPYDGCRATHILDELRRLNRHLEVVEPAPCTVKDLELIHPKAHLDFVHTRQALAGALEVSALKLLPFAFSDWRILKPMRAACGGTLTACELALEYGLAINLAGGYHHAGPTEAGGFCVYADVPYALTVLYGRNAIESALIIDVDAHQGNGTAIAVAGLGWCKMADIFDDAIFPSQKVETDWDAALPAGSGWSVYQLALRELMSKCLLTRSGPELPDLVIINNGVDVLRTDKLSTLKLEVEDVVERDESIITECQKLGIPVAMTLSGGYGPETVTAFAASINNLLTLY